jgi:N-acetylmuramoyl-L-alanine amidase
MISTYLGADSKVIKVKIQDAKTQPAVPAKKPAVSGKTVVIDPGHGGNDYGAIRNNVNEKDINLDISKRVREILKKQGYSVYMTRENDIFVSLDDRVVFAQKRAPDIFVSIHVNSSVKPEITGIETHYYHQESYTLAQKVHASLASSIKSPNRGLFKSKFYVINHTTMPAILVEIGFISNDAERAALTSPARKEATAKAIAEGVINYFK